MRIVIQKVTQASVTINGKVKAAIGKGYLILVGIESADTEEDAAWLVKKIIGLRIFEDENGVMNLSINQVGGDIIVVSQFTLMASYKKGNRPSWLRAAPQRPDAALRRVPDGRAQRSPRTGRAHWRRR